MKKKITVFCLCFLLIAVFGLSYAIYKSPKLIADKDLKLKLYHSLKESTSSSNIIDINITVHKKNFAFSNPQYYATLTIGGETFLSELQKIEPENPHNTISFQFYGGMDNISRKYYYFETPTNFQLEDAIFYIDYDNDRLEYSAIKNPDDDALRIASEFYKKHRKE